MPIVCPDCKQEQNRVEVELCLVKHFELDEDAKAIKPTPDSHWEESDTIKRCANCGSLNIDDELRQYRMPDDLIETVRPS